MFLDHVNKWLRIGKREFPGKKIDNKRGHPTERNMVLLMARVESLLADIDPSLLARAALECKSYARSLMNFERQTVEAKK